MELTVDFWNGIILLRGTTQHTYCIQLDANWCLREKSSKWTRKSTHQLLEAASLITATAQANPKWFLCITTVQLCGLKISYCKLPITKAVSTPHTTHAVIYQISSNRTAKLCSLLKKHPALGSMQPSLFGVWQALAEAHYTHSSNRRCCCQMPVNVPAVFFQTSVSPLQLNT